MSERSSDSIQHCRGKIQKDAALASYNAWRVGGSADILFKPADLEDLSLYLSQTSSSQKIVYLGLGSNTLVRDAGIRGTVILTMPGLGQSHLQEDDILYAEAGVACAKLARQSARLSLEGLEFFSGIPGTVGGAVAMNAGCFQSETWNHVVYVDVINRSGEISRRSPETFTINYRQVEGLAKDEWFVAAGFRLSKGNSEKSLGTIRTMLSKRAETQPTGDHTCGSVFRNPEGDYAGRLIESCGLKNFKMGHAFVSPKHANFFVNDGEASARDIEDLINTVAETVFTKCGIRLVPEVHIIREKIK